jgi:hypothetical protein
LDLLYAPLQRLTRFRVHLAEALAREKNYFLTFLFLKFSGFSQGQPFSDPFGATSSALLEEFTTEELVETPVEKLAEYLDTKGRGRFEDPQQLAASLQRLARDSYRLDCQHRFEIPQNHRFEIPQFGRRQWPVTGETPTPTVGLVRARP